MNTIARLANKAISSVQKLRGKAEAKVLSPEDAAASPVLDQSFTTIEGDPASMKDFHGKVVLVVNTASQCGYTAQYEGLEALQQEFGGKGLQIVGFPCDDFGHQEPGTDAEIADSCKVRWGVTFPLASKVHVEGPEQDPIYKVLTEETPEALKGRVAWNFTKFLVNREGQPIGRFEPAVTPESAELRDAIQSALG